MLRRESWRPDLEVGQSSPSPTPLANAGHSKALNVTCGSDAIGKCVRLRYKPRTFNPWSAPMASQFLARPFAALRPTAESAADVIAPPYDVVSTDEARVLAANRPASFLHISRPEIDLPPGSSPYSDAAYERGAANLARLREGGVLVRDREPSFYVYRMVMNGRAQTGVAFAASVAAYQANRIRRHELTRPD